ncbi:acyltransferase family protein [Spirosoma validum]|uniref:Acyltransferase n=1 Tax=Spirosoma validum TaxID=2771355 RepID=A0A927B6H7_9BACT|nr:acyltransferase [Spirosoma validum]MBD2756106.1 acyltransferase [Spirosoma validum]
MKPVVSSSHHTNNFDVIRLVASVFVLITHSYQLSGRFHTESEFMEQFSGHHFPLSYFGVGIFFIISGYLISQSLYRSASALDYLRKRVARIFPGLVVMVLLTIFVLGPLFTTFKLSTYFSDPETYTYLKNCLLFKSQSHLPGVFLRNPTTPMVNGSLWTLVYEFSFYLVLLFCYQTGLLRFRFLNLALFGIGISVFTLLKEIPIYYNYYPSINMSPGDLMRFLLFFWSGVLAFLYRDRISYTGNGALLAATGCISLIYLRQYDLFNSLAYILLPYLIFYLAYIQGSLNDFGRHGDFSYGIYIYGYPVQQAIVSFYPNMQGIMLMVLSVLIVAPLAWMSWFWVESPALRWIKSKKQKLALESNIVSS